MLPPFLAIHFATVDLPLPGIPRIMKQNLGLFSILSKQNYNYNIGIRSTILNQH